MEDAHVPRRGYREILPALAILLVTWLLLWMAQGIPTLCALANPCPAPDVRVAPALLFGGLMLIPAVVLIAFPAIGRPTAAGVRVVAYVLLVGLAVVGLGAVLFSGGFSIGTF
ncbi:MULTISPECIES: hypothetical protein [unclassified Microbacterium]|uniref:hypothetical protein n=1 Tax=unclassified Microbacterium TaxID=2609290 RepID=UPI0016054D96|nr:MULTISPECIES: hypothetical protein [unclassified Microbacterium]QNA92205.1 hypothetical protein G4G29_07005 [Microbacterium sp. Se63.02b]QYM65471.1 hypothetical protein K1X59_07065 [Microbacterium sp. Se5.02b]